MVLRFLLLALLPMITGREPATEYSDLDGNGGTDIFDLRPGGDTDHSHISFPARQKICFRTAIGQSP